MESKLLDKAFVNSILSYGIYTEREWFFQSVHPPKPISTLREKYDHILSEYVGNIFHPVSLEHLNGRSKSNIYGYQFDHTYQNGLYTSLDNLSKAGVFISKNEHGENVLHLTFRGTDINAQSFIKFATKAYLDMSAYYDSFKPLEQAIINYIVNPGNQIKSIQLSGHSLGGSMVQEFLKSEAVKKLLNERSDLKIDAFTYGAPGSNKIHPYSIATSVYHSIKTKNFLLLGSATLEMVKDVFFGFQQILIQKNENFNEEKHVGPKKKKSFSFLSLSKLLLNPFKDIFNNIISDAPQEKHEKIFFYQFRDTGDPIPMAGNFVYKKTGKIKTLFDYVQNDDLSLKIVNKENTSHEDSLIYLERNDYNNIKFKKEIYLKENIINIIMKRFERLKSAKYHDMLRYSLNLEFACKNSLIDTFSDSRIAKKEELQCHYLNQFTKIKHENLLQQRCIRVIQMPSSLEISQKIESIRNLPRKNQTLNFY